MQEREEELKENNMKWDVMGLGEVRRKEESFTTVQSGHLLYHSCQQWTIRCRFPREQEMERQHNKSILWEFQSSRTIHTHNRQIQLKIVQVYAPTTSHSDEETDNFYNTIEKILEKQTHYTIVMGDFNAKVGGQTNTSERAT